MNASAPQVNRGYSTRELLVVVTAVALLLAVFLQFTPRWALILSLASGIAFFIYARATPVLGDLISAHDIGSELAKQIRDEADETASKARRELNEPARKAWEQADEQTIEAFHELAPQIPVTNVPSSESGNELVDPHEIAAALHDYREAMQNANFRRNVQIKGFDFDAAAEHNKQRLRERLERESQKRGPTPQKTMT